MPWPPIRCWMRCWRRSVESSARSRAPFSPYITGLTGELSKALSRRSFVPVHDRGRVLVDVAVMIADGGEAIADIDVLRHQAPVLGPVASAPTVWRALDEITPAQTKKIGAARARTRRHVWALLAASEGGIPASKVAGTDLGKTVVLDVDATIVVAHSEKEQASGTFKKTFGFHPLGVWCDNTTEFLTSMLRTGKAGSNTAVDHITVLTQAIAQIPPAQRKDLLIRCDGAGASHDLLDWLTIQGQVRGRRLDYSVGYAELTGLLDLSTWPEGMRIIVRRERPHPGAQLSLFEEADGWRYQAIATNTPEQPGVQLAFLEAATAPTPGSRTASVTPKTPAWAGPNWGERLLLGPTRRRNHLPDPRGRSLPGPIARVVRGRPVPSGCGVRRHGDPGLHGPARGGRLSGRE